MRQLSALDAQFLNVESPTTVGHVGSLIVLEPPTAPAGEQPAPWNLESVRAVFEPRLHLAAAFRQRLVDVPLGLGRPYWVDDPHFDIEFHLRELALPAPGTQQQLAEQVARIHARPLDRSRPLWEAYVITGLEGGRGAFYSKIHHAAIDGVTGAEILETILDLTPEPREVPPEDAAFVPRHLPSPLNLLGRGVGALARDRVDLLTTVPRALQYVDRLPGAANLPGARLVSDSAALLGATLGWSPRTEARTRSLKAPRTPLNGTITAHRRLAFGSVPMSEVKRVKNHFGMTVNDVVMTLTATALRRWLLDHDALPAGPLVAAVPVSIRSEDDKGAKGNQISVMLAELPTHLADPQQRLQFMRESMLDAKRAFDAVPASLLQDLSTLLPTALSSLAARALFKLATVPGVPFNLFVSNIPGPQMALYIAGAKVVGIYPMSAVTDLTGGLNITLFSYDGSVDFGLVACREMVPDVWNLIGYLQEAMTELAALVPAAPPTGDAEQPAGKKSAAAKRSAAKSAEGKKAAAKAAAGKKAAAKGAEGGKRSAAKSAEAGKKTATGKTAAARRTAPTAAARKRSAAGAGRATSAAQPARQPSSAPAKRAATRPTGAPGPTASGDSSPSAS
jgi:diacylglycerol O-acyltransferase / wax synthase